MINPDKPIPSRISLRTDRCWLIRATLPGGLLRYMVTDAEWSDKCTDATLFRTFEAAEHTMVMLRVYANIPAHHRLDVGLLSSAIVQHTLKSLEKKSRKRKP